MKLKLYFNDWMGWDLPHWSSVSTCVVLGRLVPTALRVPGTARVSAGTARQLELEIKMDPKVR